MDPEEEKILRSSSPYIVPEIIVQRNESVKSILKKTSNNSSNASPSLTTNGGSNASSPTGNFSNNNTTTTTSSTTTSPFGKKRVDFGENFLFFNFFDAYTDDEKPDKASPVPTSGNNSNKLVTSVPAVTAVN